MSIQTFKPTKGPKPIGPYSVAKIFNGMILVSGQIPLCPVQNKIVQGGIQPETHQVMKNLSAILQEAGSSLENILKATIYLVDMEDFPKVNDVYGSYFKADPPARVCIAVKELPKKSRVEIDVIAALNASVAKPAPEEKQEAETEPKRGRKKRKV